jgi:predicted DNA-binding protein (UPF0251 family)
MPDKNYFKPRGIPASELEEVVLSLDEYEAIRLADYEQLYQENAAAQMNISRQTFGRIIESAHKKVAAVLLFGKALKIEGGEVSVGKKKQTACPECNKALNLGSGSSREKICPYCRQKR